MLLTITRDEQVAFASPIRKNIRELVVTDVGGQLVSLEDVGGRTIHVRKNSDHQTAIQWSADAQAKCPELARREGIYESCPRLKASIEAAVREGRLPIGATE